MLRAQDQEAGSNTVAVVFIVIFCLFAVGVASVALYCVCKRRSQLAGQDVILSSRFSYKIRRKTSRTSRGPSPNTEEALRLEEERAKAEKEEFEAGY